MRSGRDDKFIAPERLNCRSLGFAPNDTEQRVGSATTPLKPKEGLNGGPPQASFGHFSVSTCSRQVEMLGMTKGRGGASIRCDGVGVKTSQTLFIPDFQTCRWQVRLLLK